MAYQDVIFGFERRTTGQLRPPGTRIRKPYKGHDTFHIEEERYEATNPYQKAYTTTREDRKSHRPKRKNATGSPPHWQDPEQHAWSSSKTKTRGTSGLRHDEYLRPDPGAFQSNGRSREERHHQSSGSHDNGLPPRRHSPARSHRSSGSQASHFSYHDGLTPMEIDPDVDHDRNWSSYWPSTPKTQYHPDPPTPGKGFPEGTTDSMRR